MTFAEKVYKKLILVPKGKVITYKNLANSLGVKAYRAVGLALKNNPYSPEVPCHRVVRSDGTIGGFMGSTGGINIETKIKMLRAEGIEIKDGKIVDFHRRLFAK